VISNVRSAVGSKGYPLFKASYHITR